MAILLFIKVFVMCVYMLMMIPVDIIILSQCCT